MSNTTKPISRQDYENIHRYAYNEVDASITTNGFLVGKVGRKVSIAISTTSVSNDTELVSFLEGSTLLYTLRLIYADTNRTQLLSAERIA